MKLYNTKRETLSNNVTGELLELGLYIYDDIVSHTTNIFGIPRFLKCIKLC